jgi:acyl carrier protein
VTKEDILRTLDGIFRDVLDDDGLTLARETTAADVADWDSLANVRLMVATESEFGIRFETDELTQLPSVGALVDLIERKLA